MARDLTSPRCLFDKKYKLSLSTMEDGSRKSPRWWRQLVCRRLQNREGAGAGVYGKNSDTSLTIQLRLYSTVLQTKIEAILQCACIGISNRSITEDINKWLAEKHQEEWYKATARKQAKALMGKHLNPKRAANMRWLSGAEMKTLTNARSSLVTSP